MVGTIATRAPRSMTPGREPFTSLREEMERLLSNFWDGGEAGWFATTNPSVDISETEKAVEVRMDLPGMQPKDIDVKLNNGLLTITGERKEEKEEKGKKFHRVERRAGMFSRSFTLPCRVSETEVAAEYKDGVLTITLPKSEEEVAKKIEVKA